MTDLSFLSFEELLAAYFERPGVEAELARRFGRSGAVLVVDFTGMVERTNAYGIGYALALAAAAQRVMLPAFDAHGGARVKQVADTVFVVFDQPGAALSAAADAQRALAAFNEGRTGHIGHAGRNEPIHGCIGLGYGELLVIPRTDIFGAEVNRAFVLGEDVARGGEILATPAFLAALGGLPQGFGAFAGPSERVKEAGFPFHVVRDFRS